MSHDRPRHRGCGCEDHRGHDRGRDRPRRQRPSPDRGDVGDRVHQPHESRGRHRGDARQPIGTSAENHRDHRRGGRRQHERREHRGDQHRRRNARQTQPSERRQHDRRGGGPCHDRGAGEDRPPVAHERRPSPPHPIRQTEPSATGGLGADDQGDRRHHAQPEPDRLDDRRIDPDQHRPGEQHRRQSASPTSHDPGGPCDQHHHGGPPHARAGDDRRRECDHADECEPPTDRPMPSQQRGGHTSDDRQVPSTDRQHRGDPGILGRPPNPVVKPPAVAHQHRLDHAGRLGTSRGHRRIDESDRRSPRLPTARKPGPQKMSVIIAACLHQPARGHHEHRGHAVVAAPSSITLPGIGRRRHDRESTDHGHHRTRNQPRVDRVESHGQPPSDQSGMRRRLHLDHGPPSGAIGRVRRHLVVIDDGRRRRHDRLEEAPRDPHHRIDAARIRMSHVAPDLVRQHPSRHEPRHGHHEQHEKHDHRATAPAPSPDPLAPPPEWCRRGDRHPDRRQRRHGPTAHAVGVLGRPPTDAEQARHHDTDDQHRRPDHDTESSTDRSPLGCRP